MRILIATDGSECSRHALSEAQRLLALEAAEVTVIAVTQPVAVGVDPYILAPPPMDPAFYDREREHTDAALADAERRLADGGVKASLVSREGDPAREILAFADEWGADLIVLGSHGRNALERLMLGSVSEAVVRHRHGAVLIVRPAS